MNFQFLNFFRSIKNILILANILLVFFLILLNNLNVLPVRGIGDFVFFAVLAFAFALYRPGWAFLFFVGMIALENINLAPASVGINIRPYQFIGGLTLLAVLIRLITKRLNFSLPKWNWADGLIVVFAVSGFLSVLGSSASESTLKQAIIMASFAALYFLTRIFIQNIDDLKRIIPFFLSSSVIVISFGIWQNIRFMKGLESFEVMPGRPNATFTEPDWLGIYITLLSAVLYSLIYYLSTKNSETEDARIFNFQSRVLGTIFNEFSIFKFLNLKTLLYIILVTAYILLILTVSRSAWLGAAAVSILYLVYCIWYFVVENKSWREFFRQFMFLLVAGVSSVALVYVFNLTSFQLFNRAQSVGTGLQKITVSCQDASQADQLQRIEKMEQLSIFNCRHINLEEIETEKARGHFVKEIYRPDPNINIRQEIYQKSWAEIKTHPLLGIGWGNISNILGRDGRGAGLNASNIFLEVWLGAGILGISSLVLFLIFGIIKAVKFFFSPDTEEKFWGLFLILGFAAILIPNLFNAGLFLGFVWIYLGIAVSLNYANRN